MSYDVSSNGLLGIRIEHCTWSTIDLGNDLVGNDDCDPELICQPLKSSHKLGQMSLSGRQLSSSNKVCSIQRSGAINDEKREPCLTHHRRSLVEQLKLMIGVVGASIRNIVENFFSR